MPNDYGASWSTLWLAPVLGALGAWIGVLLVQFLARVRVLDAHTFGQLWDHPTRRVAMVAAFLLGFSERLFARVVSLSENKISATNTDKSA